MRDTDDAVLLCCAVCVFSSVAGKNKTPLSRPGREAGGRAGQEEI